MRKLVTATLLAVLAGVSPALANSDSDRLAQAGMLGSWAVDCNKPPSQANPYQLIAPSSSGSPTRALQMDDPSLKVTHKISDVRLIAKDRVSAIWTNLKGESYRIILLKVGNRHKSIDSVLVRGGKVLVIDGHFVSSGKQTPWFTKCGKN